MRRKPGPQKKPGERYPSGDLKPVIAPALWGRIRDLSRDQQPGSELGRLCFHRELTDTQAAAGFLIAHIYRSGDSEGSGNERGDATTAAMEGDPHASQKDRKALDDLLSEYAPKLREAVIELCVLNRTVDWKLRPQIRQLLDRVALWRWPNTRRRQADGGSKLARRSIPPRMPPLDRAHKRRRLEASIQAPERTEPRPDCDLDVEAVDKLIAALRPDLDADGKARLIDHFVALRDREEFRQKKLTDRGGAPYG